MAPTKAEKPRLRVFSPKVRTGCGTCKKRRKKCDEEKPVCRRCRVEDYICDGYPNLSSLATKQQQQQQRRQQQQKPKSHYLVKVNNHVVPKSRLPGDTFVHYFQHHFFTHTIHDMMDLPKATAFWNKSLVSLQQYNSFIQPAVTALGATHWLFLAGVERTNHMQRFVIDQYNQAIANLIPSMAAARLSDIEPILACCFLFVCLESLRGNQSEAMRHLEAGSRLFSEQLQSRSSETTLQWLAAMFQSLGNQAALFAERQVLPDLTDFLPALEFNPAKPFATLDEANEALDRLDNTFNKMVWNCPEYCSENDKKCPDNCNCGNCAEWIVFQEQVATFTTQFQPLMKKTEADGDIDQKHRLLRLQLVLKAWQIIVDDDETSEHFLPEDSDELLDLIERILKLSAHRPTFSLSADIIPALIDVYDYSPGADRRMRAIRLLRSHQLREVVFTSHQVADFLEDHFSKLCLGEEVKEDPDENSPMSSNIPPPLQYLPYTPSLRSQMWETSSTMANHL